MTRSWFAANRSSRRLGTVVALAVGVLSMLTVQRADAAATYISSYSGMAGGWRGASLNCSTYAESTYSPRHVANPDSSQAQVNRAVLAVSESTSADNAIAIDLLGRGLPLTALHGFDSFVYVPASGGVTPALVIEATDGTTDFALSLASLPAASWVSEDVTTAQLSWDAWDDASGREVATNQQTTLSAFVSAHPDLTLVGLSIEPSTPCVAGSFYLDYLHFAAGSTDESIDFDVPDVTSLSDGVSTPTSVPIGTTLTLSTRLHNVSRNLDIPGNTVSLWSRPAGASTYRKIWSGLTDDRGAASRVLTVSTTTTYQWRFGGIGAGVAPATSRPYTITTHTGVAISAKPAQAGYHAQALIRGRVTPAQAGITVRLIRLLSSGQTVVDTVRTTSGGYFTMYAPMNLKGTARYVLRALAYAGEPTRQSFIFTIVTI